MERAEFLRKQAERFLALAQECADPNVKAKLVEMANEYIELMNAASLAGPEDKANKPSR
jgi:HEPN domain-containing protein